MWPLNSCAWSGWKKQFEYFFCDPAIMDSWKRELAEQLPNFFKCCNEDIHRKLYEAEVKKKVVKQKCAKSIDRTSDIIECLRSKMK